MHPLHTLADLTLKDALYVIALIRSSSSVSSDGHVGPITSVPPLTPGYEFDHEMICISHLAARKLISFSIYTDASAFTVENDKIKTFDAKTAIWKVHLESFADSLLQLNEIIAHSRWPLKWRHEFKTVWLDLAMLECMEFLEYLCNERDFNLEMTDADQNHLLTLLRHHSVSQCFNLMHEAVRDASDNVVKNTQTKADAGHALMEACFQNQNRLQANQQANRPYTIPQSQLSYVFHHEFLKIGEAGFTETPYDLSVSA